jgi:hypothetical protein
MLPASMTLFRRARARRTVQDPPSFFHELSRQWRPVTPPKPLEETYPTAPSPRYLGFYWQAKLPAQRVRRAYDLIKKH